MEVHGACQEEATSTSPATATATCSVLKEKDAAIFPQRISVGASARSQQDVTGKRGGQIELRIGGGAARALHRGGIKRVNGTRCRSSTLRISIQVDRCSVFDAPVR